MSKPMASDFEVTSYNDLFGNDDEKKLIDGLNRAKEEIKILPLSELHERADHPFKVRRDTQMDELVGSIKEIGVMQPGMARPRKEGGYEVLAGYRRWLGCEIAGLSEMPFIVGNYDDDTAIRIMIHTNKYRDSFLPSEKARAYKMDYEAAKRQGKRNGGKKTLEEMAEEFGESWKTIQRFIWLARLNDELLEMVDAERIGISQGVALSFLNEEEQGYVQEIVEKTGCKISKDDAEKLKGYSKEGNLTYALAKEVLVKKKSAVVERKVTIKEKNIKEYFPESYTSQEIEKVLYQLLDEWKKKQNFAENIGDTTHTQMTEE